MLFAAGSSGGQIKVFDVKSGSNPANFDCLSSVTSLSFSENGTWLASTSEGQTTVTIWDLRKGERIKQLEFGAMISSIDWDYTGQFLAAGGPSGIAVQSYTKGTKSWTEIFRTAVPSTVVKWGPRAQSLLSVVNDGVLTVLSAA
jgi:pre-mRNA-processing factor 19